METIDNIIADEGGVARTPYLCTSKKWTWLIGRNIEDMPLQDFEWGLLRKFGIDRGAHHIFQTNIDNLRVRLMVKAPCFLDLPGEAQTIMLNMAYNMGLTKFNPDLWPNFFAAVERGDWLRAATEMKYTDRRKANLSMWYRQTKGRADRLVKAMGRLSLTP